MKRAALASQRGVAIITALMLTALAVTIVASLFWQQQVQVRSIENQRLHLQTKWILRGALDWARLVLREDAKFTSVDTLDEPWAVPLAETRLDQYVENGRSGSDQSDATLSGRIVDAQARFNLANLAQGGTVNPREVAVFARLLGSLQLNAALAQAVADAVARAQPAAAGTAGSAGQPLALLQVDDVLAVPGFTAPTLAALRDFVVMLPAPAQLNVNTASAEVLAARIDTLSQSDAAALVAAREKAYFRSSADFIAHLPQGKAGAANASEFAVATSFFIVYGTVRLNRASMDMQALIERNGGSTRLIWMRDN
ncbi:type II secretion system minor pseudopilin GspK [Herminiimonas sp. CN]|uniref:type II secretion system minor pseudopilin GspK n=1 Tax=Herminiimonas sp. CN TaxID=1349818 RepID=UPI0004731966|nr:type II secretion system minor pseudopilin GspK [Herminiimonas sp. CN]